jgi:hypothetical protein
MQKPRDQEVLGAKEPMGVAVLPDVENPSRLHARGLKTTQIESGSDSNGPREDFEQLTT